MSNPNRLQMLWAKRTVNLSLQNFLLKINIEGGEMENTEDKKHDEETSYARIEPYTNPAGGWGALLSVARNLKFIGNLWAQINKQSTEKTKEITRIIFVLRHSRKLRFEHFQKLDENSEVRGLQKWWIRFFSFPPNTHHQLLLRHTSTTVPVISF